MIDSHLVRSLRITFLSIGFVVFVIMAVHWIQHVSTARPQLTPRVIATTPSLGGLAVTEANSNLQASSLASFVQAGAPATNETSPQITTPTATPQGSQPTPAPRQAVVRPAPATHSLPAEPDVPSTPTHSHESNGQPPVGRVHPEPMLSNPPHIMRTPRDY